MLLAPLIIVVAGIARVTSRIVRGWVRRNVRTIIGSAHPLKKSAPDSEAQAYIAYLGEVNFEGTPPEMAT
jgi:hypothetical protein